MSSFDSNGVERVYEYARFVDLIRLVAGERYTAPHILMRQVVTPFIQIPGSEYGITSDGFFELDECKTSHSLLVLATHRRWSCWCSQYLEVEAAHEKRQTRCA